MRNAFKFIGQALATFVLVAGAVVLLAGVLVPRLTGASTYAVLANSMAPRYPIGTLMVVRPSDTISTGDIITFQIRPDDPTVVTHRVVAVGSTLDGEPRFTTQGDNNQVPDVGYIQPEQIRGVLWYSIPFAGYLVVATDGWRENASVVAAALLALYALWQIIRTIQEKAQMKKQSRNPHVAGFEQLAAEVDAALAELSPASTPAKQVVEVMMELPLNVNAETHTNASPVVVAESNSFMPTMTRAERRRLQNQTADPEYSLVS